jgi:Tol biopolymer transport system component
VSYLIKLLSAFLGIALCIVGCERKSPGKSKANNQAVYAVSDKSTFLATIADDEKPQSVTPSAGAGMHAPLSASFQPIFSQLGGGVGYSAEKNGKVYVVHNGKPGKNYATIGAIALSPDGSRIAYGALVDGKWCMVIDGMEDAFFNTVKAPVFSPDGKHLAYQAMAGEKWHLVVDGKANAGTKTRVLDHIFSGDSTKIAFIDDVDDKNKGRLVVSDLEFTKQNVIASNVSLMILNEEKTRIAAISISDNKQRVIEFSFDKLDAVRLGLQYDVIKKIAFGTDNVSLAYYAERDGKSFMVLNGREETLPEGMMMEPPVIRSDQKGVGAIIATNKTAYLHHSFDATGQKDKEYDEVANLVYSSDSRFYTYAARKGNDWFAVVNSTEGPVFDRVVTPLISPDGKFLVYRARKDGKRFVVVADSSARTIKTHPIYEQVFDVQFTADGKSVAYGVKDGQKLIWKVERL